MIDRGVMNLTQVTRPLAILYFLQGVCYLALFLWRGVFSKIGFFRAVKKSMLIISSLSTILWIFPAILSFGNALTYLTDPNIPPDIAAQWVHFLWTGVFFSAIGLMNIASIVYKAYCLTRPSD